MDASVESDASGPLPDDELTLAEAAGRIGCGVETLRRRIRAGKLKARRGPYGAYRVQSADVDRVFLKPRSDRSPRLTEDESWAALERLIRRYRSTRDSCLALLAEYRTYGHRSTVVGRVLEAVRLRLAGHTYRAIAEQLGISQRQARRLGRRDPEVALRIELVRRARIADPVGAPSRGLYWAP